jgi:secreted PhoX family phosphatase
MKLTTTDHKLSVLGMKSVAKFSRRTVIGTGLSASGMSSVGLLSGCGSSNSGSSPALPLPPVQMDPEPRSLLGNIGPLMAPDENGVMLADGFTSRIVASSGGAPVNSTSFIWHDAPDGGAVFPLDTGEWIYVSNSELGSRRGGASALKFDASGNVVDAYSILSRTNRNCAGGATPWGTWLSCEETSNGIVWECDPLGVTEPIQRPQLGVFNHEAVAVNPNTNILYMTEDRPLGLFYRFIPDGNLANGIPDLSRGQLQAAVVDSSSNAVTWIDISDPLAQTETTRSQASGATTFNGGEGIVVFDNVVSFATKGDNRIWAYQTDNEVLSVIYDRDTAPNPILSGLDNMTLSQDGELVVSEDPGDLQIVAVTASGELVPLMQLVGHEGSEVTGPGFSPDGKRLYFSSQRGTEGSSSSGITFEIQGPFHI